MFATLDPIVLLRDMRLAQLRLVDLADKDGAVRDDEPTIEEFLAGLRTAWKEGEVRPTAKPAEEPKRGRCRPDPLADITDRLRDWFEAEPWQTMLNKPPRTSSARSRWPCRSMASTSVGSSGLRRLPQVRSDASHSTTRASRTASS